MNQTKRIRNSSIELLRIICIFGIITMHTFGQFYSTASGINLFYGVVINSIFNMGVSIFMLISGYYGVRFSLKKMVELELCILFYSIFGIFIQSLLIGNVSFIEFCKSFLPISTNKYWYMTCYIIIFIFSPFINEIIKNLTQNQFKKLIFYFLIIFSILPTFIYFHIMGDNGKGLMNMLLIFLIGRYLKLYKDKKIDVKKCQFSLIFIIIFNIFINYSTSLLVGGGVGLFAPFARDCSITIIVGSVLVFLLFKSVHFHSKIINKLASYSFSLYLSESSIRLIFQNYFDLSKFISSPFLALIIFIYVILIILNGLIIEFFRRKIFVKLDKYILKTVQKILQIIQKPLMIWRQKNE